MAGAVMSALPNAVRPSSRGFYAWFATGAFLIIFAGFARTYYLRPIFEVRPLPFCSIYTDSCLRRGSFCSLCKRGL